MWVEIVPLRSGRAEKEAGAKIAIWKGYVNLRIQTSLQHALGWKRGQLCRVLREGGKIRLVPGAHGFVLAPTGKNSTALRVKFAAPSDLAATLPSCIAAHAIVEHDGIKALELTIPDIAIVADAALPLAPRRMPALPPAVASDDRAAIERHIAEKGVTVCPPKAVAAVEGGIVSAAEAKERLAGVQVQQTESWRKPGKPKQPAPVA